MIGKIEHFEIFGISIKIDTVKTLQKQNFLGLDDDTDTAWEIFGFEFLERFLYTCPVFYHIR